jgi:prolyl oligopeptidase
MLLTLYTATGHAQEKPMIAKIQPVVDEYFGKKISDPYRYMENLQDPEVQTWFKSQADYARSVLDDIPGRQSLINKMREFDKRKKSIINYLIITDNDLYFYLKTTPEDETGKLFYRNGYEGKENFLYDPQTFSPDTSQKYVISGLSPSDDGKKIAIEVAPSGSESSILLIMNVQEKTFYPEKIDRCWFASPSWLPSGDAFLFNRLQSSDVHDTDREKDSKTYLHTVGTDPGTDREIFSREKYPELGIKPEYFPMVSYDKDSQYLFGFVLSVDRRMHVYYAPTTEINKERINWKELIKKENEIYDFSATETELYLYTPKDAPNFKLLKTSLKNPDLANAEVVVAENPQEILRSFALTNEGIYYTLSQNGVTEKLYRLPYGK